MTSALTISFSSPAASRETDAFVLLEQEPWDPSVGMLTLLGAYAYLNNLLFGGPAPVANCGPLGASFSKKIYAYPSRAGLAYRFGLSWGSGMAPVREELDYTEAVQCDLQTEMTLTYPPRSISRYEWVGDAWDREGTVIARPEVTIGSAGVTLAAPVYGTLLITYKVERYVHAVTIPPRPDAGENRYQSFAWAVWSGGTVGLEIERPAGAEEDVCNNSLGTGSATIPDTEPGPWYLDPVDTSHDIDYCTGEEIA